MYLSGLKGVEPRRDTAQFVVKILNTSERLVSQNLEIGLGHVIQNTARIISHGNISVTVHPPIGRPLVANNPVTLSLAVVLTSRVSTAAAAVFFVAIASIVVCIS